MAEPPMWQCPDCGRSFANRNQWHSCVSVTVDDHLRDASPEIVALFDGFVDLLGRCGPFTFAPVKTRIGFKVRMTFAEVVVQKRGLACHVVLARRLDSPRFSKIVSMPPRTHVHSFRVDSPDDLDDEFAGWLCEAYEVGEQRHLDRPPGVA